MMRLAVALVVALAGPAEARSVHGRVIDDDGRGVPDVVVASGAQFVAADVDGWFDIDVSARGNQIVWARVPDGFRPGPAWTRVAKDTAEITLHRLATPHRGPLTFVVAADTHLAGVQPFALDLARVADDATALDPPPAFFTILGDVTQGGVAAELTLVDEQLAGLTVPYVPVPGNHDWYDGGAAWFAHYGPDNYSFDIDRTHFVVWNMAMTEHDVVAYLGAELAHVAPDMTIVALTHAPPVPAILRALHRLGVGYVLSGHTHTNRAVDHDGIVELTTEPLLMGGLDFTPAGYRIVTLAGGVLAAQHHTVVDAPLLAIVTPTTATCAPDALLVAAELDAAPAQVTARIDCASPIALAYAGGRDFTVPLPPLGPGVHTLTVAARSRSGAHVERTIAFHACTPLDPSGPAGDWPQLGGDPAHTGATSRTVAPPLAPRWAAPVGGLVFGAPAIHGDTAFVTATDLARGDTGGVVALDLATGAVRWRAATRAPVRGGPAIANGVVAVAQLDGTIVALDELTGRPRWTYELGAGVPPEAASVFAAPAADAGDFLVGNQRHLAALDAVTGERRWTARPVPNGENTQSLAAVAAGGGVVVGVFHRELGGVIAWDRATGRELWRLRDQATAINASPVIAGDTVYVVNGLTEVIAIDLATGEPRWTTKLDPTGFDWGYATVGAPAIADGILVVPTLYRDLVALDATTGAELWRHAASPAPLRTTHYRGGGEAGVAASPVIAGGVVWAADTSGRLVALELPTGADIWADELGSPVYGGLAVAGDRLIVASWDGSVRDLATAPPRPPGTAMQCDAPPARGCCGSAGATDAAPALAFVCLRRRRRALRRSPSSTCAAGSPPTATSVS